MLDFLFGKERYQSCYSFEALTQNYKLYGFTVTAEVSKTVEFYRRKRLPFWTTRRSRYFFKITACEKPLHLLMVSTYAKSKDEAVEIFKQKVSASYLKWE